MAVMASFGDITPPASKLKECKNSQRAEDADSVKRACEWISKKQQKKKKISKTLQVKFTLNIN